VGFSLIDQSEHSTSCVDITLCYIISIDSMLFCYTKFYLNTAIYYTFLLKFMQKINLSRPIYQYLDCTLYIADLQ